MKKRVPLTLPEIDGAKCAECFYKRAADGSWSEFVACAIHKVPAPPAPVLKHWRVSWTEQYEKVFEAETEDAAIENRDDKDAFLECSALNAQEVRECQKCQGRGRGDHGGSCGACEGGWVAVTEEAAL